LAESTSDIIYILDRQGTLLYANQAASQCIGIRSDEIPGKRQAALFPPEMAQAHIEKIGRVFATGEVLKYDELFHFGPQEVWLHIHLVPLWDEAGQISSVMGVCHNITDRKRAEEALQKAHDELEQRVRDRTAELAKANQELAIFRKFAEASGQGFSNTVSNVGRQGAGRSHRPALINLLFGGIQSPGEAGNRACLEARRLLAG
jgi:PAS domain S-box-containing protein